MERSSLFISHANPKDNDFTVWLASRLQLMGYQVWCDVEGLIGGEKQWDEIDNIIRNESAKFLLVISKDTFIKPGKLKDGISKEFALAESIAKKLGTDFIIPLKIDKDASYDDFIGLNRYNHIIFSENWADGLKSLIEKLEKDKILTIKPDQNKILVDWYKNKFTTKYGLIKKKETYLTNWWPIEELGDTLEIYHYENEKSAEEIRKINYAVPVIRHGNTIATFGEAQTSISTESPMGKYEIGSIEETKISTKEILDKTYKSTSFPTLLDCENILKRLLTRAFHLMAKEKGLYWYELSSKRQCYFYPTGKKVNDKVKFEYNNKPKTKNLLGNFKISDELNGYWHFGVATRVILSPAPCFVLTSHILFSNDGYSIWTDHARLHSARRKKGKSWFNEEWRDQLMAFINSLKDDNGDIKIKLTEEDYIDMSDHTLRLTSEVGYEEPTSKERQNILDDEESEEELPDKQKGN